MSPKSLKVHAKCSSKSSSATLNGQGQCYSEAQQGVIPHDAIASLRDGILVFVFVKSSMGYQELLTYPDWSVSASMSVSNDLWATLLKSLIPPLLRFCLCLSLCKCSMGYPPLLPNPTFSSFCLRLRLCAEEAKPLEHSSDLFMAYCDSEAQQGVIPHDAIASLRDGILVFVFVKSSMGYQELLTYPDWSVSASMSVSNDLWATLRYSLIQPFLRFVFVFVFVFVTNNRLQTHTNV